MNKLGSDGRVVAADAKSVAPKLAADEKVLQMFVGVALYVTRPNTEAPTAEGSGALYVTDKNVIWLNGSNAESNYTIRVRDISMHAINRSPPLPCLYAHVDEPANETSEVRFVPASADAKVLDLMYEYFSKSAELNPDVPSPGDDDDSEGDFFFNQSEVQSNLNTLSMAERAQQNKLLQSFNSVPASTATATAAASSGAAAASASAAGGKSDSKKETPQQTQKKITSLFDALPDPNPQLAAALVAAKPKNGAAAAAVVPANFDDAEDDDDADDDAGGVKAMS